MVVMMIMMIRMATTMTMCSVGNHDLYGYRDHDDHQNEFVPFQLQWIWLR